MNFRKLITGVRPQTNNSRRYLWALEYKKATGQNVKSGGYKFCNCRICKKPFLIKSDVQISPLDITCSKKCFLELEELRADKHWS